ncbi:MAG: type I DNA topoisomerase, partial [Chloroflexi bacterium]|nr:type I DNA topoisomerase [Chloroflexota bacterium]
MAKNLVIVESPAKARTVGRFLGNKYVAMASMGHVRDLPKGEIGVNVEDGSFTPKYVIIDDRKKTLAELRAELKDADVVYLATDPDREGEAISWHLLEAAKIDIKKTKRVVFHEITKQAIEEAFANPRELDIRLINAQQARRILDRLVGYELSPVLWRKVRRGLSAGRVQSVALRLVVERYNEHTAFVPQEYWSIDALLTKQPGNGTDTQFKAKFFAPTGEKKAIEIPNEAEAKKITGNLEGAVYTIESVQKKEKKSRPSPAFITSTLQQEASRKLRFTARKTMQIAQQLYEGLSIGDEEVGLITYMRTDSTNVAASAVSETRDYIKKAYGAEYVPDKPRSYSKKVKGAQEAHEAIRPTSTMRVPIDIRAHLTADQYKLYDLVWKRMVSSQMEDALFDSTSISITAHSAKSGEDYTFRASGSVMKFPGFRAIYLEGKDDSDSQDDETSTLPELTKGESVNCLGIEPGQHFTQPPALYNEATLVKALEEKGIGRPSTYAAIISTLTYRDYVRKEKGRFEPSKLGIAVNGLLIAHFPNIMDINFTAEMEKELDDIASGEREWKPVLKDFYGPFNESVGEAMTNAERVPRDQIDEESDEVCEECERPMVIKSGRFGRFLSCSGFPECKNSKPLLKRTGVDCTEDGG